MKKMRKIVVLLMVAAMLLPVIAGCSGGDPDDRGAHIHMWLGADPSNINFDPALRLFDRETGKWISLAFQGLTVVDSQGRLLPGMARSWEVMERDEDGNALSLHIELIESAWSDGIQLAAEHFVDAWERILQPDFVSPAAALLFDIKNARAVKEGYLTVADLGIAAPDITILEITFERGTDYERFLRNLASIALVPIRSVTVENHPEDWAWGERNQAMWSNGPFRLTNVEFGNRAMFERSTNYRVDPGLRNRPAEDRHVRPHRLYTHFRTTLNDMATAFNTESVGAYNVFFLGDVPRERFNEFSGNAELVPMLSSYAVHFNANVAPFDRPEVRRALSVALDRNHIANTLAAAAAAPATGIVPAGTIGINPTGNDFRTEAGQVISPEANMAEARSLLQSAGVTSGAFELKFRDTIAHEVAIAEYVAGVWRELGFNVTLRPVRGRAFADDALAIDYDVMLHDFQAPGVCAFSVLAPFAMPFSGNAKTFNPVGGYWESAPFVTGFQSDRYDALMEEIALIDDNATRNERLRDAERMLAEYMPIAPLVFNTSVNITDARLTGVTYSRFGFPIFTRANLRNHLNYTTTVPPRN